MDILAIFMQLVKTVNSDLMERWLRTKAEIPGPI